MTNQEEQNSFSEDSPKDDQNSFFEDASKDEKWFVEIPPEVPSPYSERVPSGFDPMGQVYLQGQAYSRLSEGQIPWWIMISSWLVFGLPALIFLGSGLVEDVSVLTNLSNKPEDLPWIALMGEIAARLLRLLLLACVLYILGRGTAAKLHPKRRSPRKNS